MSQPKAKAPAKPTASDLQAEAIKLIQLTKETQRGLSEFLGKPLTPEQIDLRTRFLNQARRPEVMRQVSPPVREFIVKLRQRVLNEARARKAP